MLTSRLEAVFDEFLNKVKDEFKIAKMSEIDHTKIRKEKTSPFDQTKIRKAPANPNFRIKEEKPSRFDFDNTKLRKVPVTQNYRFKEERHARLDDHPSFMLKKRNLLPGWYSPMESRSTELKTKYSKKFGKLEKKHTTACLDDRRAEYSNRKRAELRKRDYASPTNNVEINNAQRCICKHDNSEDEHIYEKPIKNKLARDLPHFRFEGASMIGSRVRTGNGPKKMPTMPTMSAFTLTSLTSNSSEQ